MIENWPVYVEVMPGILQALLFPDAVHKHVTTRWCGDVSHFGTEDPTMRFLLLLCTNCR